MKKALIEPGPRGRVCAVVDTEFPVAPTFRWIDCPDNTPVESEYKNGVFSAPVAEETTPDPDFGDFNSNTKMVKALLLASASMAGKTPAQARAAFRAAWDSLP